MQDLNFLYEMGCLRFVQRTWKFFQNPDFANVTEHVFRTMWIALTIAKFENCTDAEKIMKMVLVHDITEVRTNDVNYLSRQYVERYEEKAMLDQLAQSALGDEFEAIWREYEKRESLAAKIVKDADNLDVDMELQEQSVRGVTLANEWHTMRERVEAEKLFTKTARRMWKEIKVSNPHEWHLQAPNRFTHGDWKKVENEEIGKGEDNHANS
jgi:5'-deoxynucleotidase YfbR-like HD superfamily hydrolase